MTKSQRAVPSSVVGHVSTVKMDGSAWSNATVLITMNLARSYLNQHKQTLSIVKTVEMALAHTSPRYNFGHRT